MGEIKVEHALLFLVGVFLAYHMMCKYRLVGGSLAEGHDPCEGTYTPDCKTESVDGDISKISKTEALSTCSDYWEWGLLNNYQCDGTPQKAKNPVTKKQFWQCRKGTTKCSLIPDIF